MERTENVKKANNEQLQKCTRVNFLLAVHQFTPTRV